MIGIVIEVNSPFVVNAFNLTTYREEIKNYSHTKRADDGDDKASFSLTLPISDIEDWFENGLGRNIVVYNAKQEEIFQGFANKITVNAGGLSAETIGPLINVGNRVSVSFSILDTSTYPPSNLGQAITTIAEDTDSQDKYGILEKVISGGSIPTDDAERIRDTYLADYKNPSSSGNISLPGSKEASIKIDLLGYIHWIKQFVSNITTTGYVALNTKIAEHLNADPNNVLEGQDLEANSYLAYRQEINNRFAYDIIRGEVSKGDIYDARFFFGVNSNRIAYYKQAPTIMKYQMPLKQLPQHIRSFQNPSELYDPMDIKPLEWLFVSDWFIGRTPGPIVADVTNHLEDPRIRLIEEVSYSYPNRIVLKGNKFDLVTQQLAKWGLGGM